MLSKTIFDFSLTYPQPINSLYTMAFAGKWETETQEGYEEFCKLVGIPDDIIAKGRDYKLITEVVQNGNEFSWSQLYPTNKSVTNKFVIDQECDMETIGGKKFKATVTMEGGKLSTEFPKYHHTSEISGGKLIEVRVALWQKMVCIRRERIKEVWAVQVMFYVFFPFRPQPWAQLC
uniref:Fatty acid binding protein 6, ileal (gastrotropin) n=1 Tax=Hucho hucho TaxID=62062 RepID=A0A4W5M2W2_9TELE